jgi:UDP-N-acetylglucosamine acyltransferase
MGEEQGRAIHETAIVSPGAEISGGVRIGPYAVIGDRVTIGEGTLVGPHTVIDGPTVIGKGNQIIGQSAIGTIPQDLKYQDEETFLSIGDLNIIREFVTINRGTEGGGGKTTVGDMNLLMTGVHIAHDCHVGQRTILANAATLAGHVDVEDDSTVGAFSGVHQECRVGVHAFVGGYSVLTRDALPFVQTVGHRNQAKIYGINSLGLRRKKFSAKRIKALKEAYRWLFQKGLKLQEAIEAIRSEDLETEDVSVLIQFVETSKRGFVRDVSSDE